MSRADRRVGRQRQQAAVVLGETQFARRAEHAEALDAAHLGLLDLDAGQLGADQRAGHLHVRRDIGRAADDLQRRRARRHRPCRASACRHRDAFRSTALRRDHDVRKRRAPPAGVSSTSRPAMVSRWHSSSRRERWIDEGAQPGFGKLHDRFLLKLGQEAQIALEEQAQIVDAVAQHGQAVRPHAEGEARVLLRIDAATCAARWDAPCRSRRSPASGLPARRS